MFVRITGLGKFRIGIWKKNQRNISTFSFKKWCLCNLQVKSSSSGSNSSKKIFNFFWEYNYFMSSCHTLNVILENPKLRKIGAFQASGTIKLLTLKLWELLHRLVIKPRPPFSYVEPSFAWCMYNLICSISLLSTFMGCSFNIFLLGCSNLI